MRTRIRCTCIALACAWVLPGCSLIIDTGGGSTDLPDWVPAPGTWAKISTNTVSDVDPCPSNDCSFSGNTPYGQQVVMDNYGSGAFASGYGRLGALVVFGGDGDGYHGNELYVFPLETRAWQRYTDPSLDTQCDEDSAEYPDGKPCAGATYDFLDYHPGTNSLIRLGTSDLPDEAGGGNVHLFSFDEDQWRQGAEKPDFYNGFGAATGYHPGRDVFYWIGTNGRTWGEYDPDAHGGSGQWIEFGQPETLQRPVAAVDPVHDLFVVLEGFDPTSLMAADLNAPDNDFLPVNYTNGEEAVGGNGRGFQWCPPLGKFVMWAGGDSIWTLTPPEDDWAFGQWVWEEIPPAAGNTTGPDSPNENGTFGRFRWAPSIQCFLLVNRTSGAVYAYRPAIP